MTEPSTATMKVGMCHVCLQKEFCIGEGSLGTKVYVGLCPKDGREVAVKILPLDVYKEFGKTERDILINVSKQPHILNYIHSEVIGEHGYLILDLCEQTLEEYVQSCSEEELKDQGPTIMSQILQGLQALHCSCGKDKILHRDLRPSNILLDSDEKMLLADFGISRSIEKEQKTLLTVPRGVPGWMAAECLPAPEDKLDYLSDEQVKVRYKTKSDIQVAGMLLFYILTKGEHPYGNRMLQPVCIAQGIPVNLQGFRDPVAKDLIQWMLEHKPEDRPSVGECLKHPYLLSTDDQFDLVTRVGNQAEVKTNDPNSPVVQQLNADTSFSNPSWKLSIDLDIQNRIDRRPLTSYNDNTTGLLRFIRNASHHWYDSPVPTAVKDEIGKLRVHFINSFPTLPMVLYKVIRNYPDWKEREELEKFFEH